MCFLILLLRTVYCAVVVFGLSEIAVPFIGENKGKEYETDIIEFSIIEFIPALCFFYLLRSPRVSADGASKSGAGADVEWGSQRRGSGYNSLSGAPTYVDGRRDSNVSSASGLNTRL